MLPVSPENAELRQALAEATLHLHAQIRQDLAALRQAVDESVHLIRDVQRERALALRNHRVGNIYTPRLLDTQPEDA
jgi:hypothetical protein